MGLNLQPSPFHLGNIGAGIETSVLVVAIEAAVKCKKELEMKLGLDSLNE